MNPSQRTRLPQAERTDANLGVHTLSQFVFCPRAGFLHWEERTDDSGIDEDPRIPNLTYQPEYDYAEIIRVFDECKAWLWTVSLTASVGLLITGLVWLTIGWLPASVLAAALVLFSGILAGREVNVVFRLSKSKQAAEAAIARCPKINHTVPEQVNWWELRAAGYEPIRLQSALRDHVARLSGVPWRILQRGGVRIPVLLHRQADRKIYAKHRIRIAAYCHLIATAEQAQAPFGLILFAGTYEAITVPVTETLIVRFQQEFSDAREIIRSHERSRQVPSRPEQISRCLGCPVGEPVLYRPGKTELVIGDIHYAAYVTDDNQSLPHVSTCGTRYQWVPPHKKAIATRMTK